LLYHHMISPLPGKAAAAQRTCVQLQKPSEARFLAASTLS
jgi:hypothetical protein